MSFQGTEGQNVNTNGPSEMEKRPELLRSLMEFRSKYQDLSSVFLIWKDGGCAFFSDQALINVEPPSPGEALLGEVPPPLGRLAQGLGHRLCEVGTITTS
jgi:hypothetical protein